MIKNEIIRNAEERFPSGFLRAAEEAKKSTFVTSNRTGCLVRIGAAIFSGRKLISSSYNQDIHVFSNDIGPWHLYHAETRAIKQLITKEVRDKKEMRKLSIYVAHLGKETLFKKSRPCDGCMKEIINAGIKKVFYTIDTFTYGEIRL